MVQLEMQDVTKRFGSHTVLKDLSLTSDAAVLGIAGANGSGKSTLLRCLSGLLKASGSIRWTIGGEMFNADELTGRIGYAAPYIELYDGLTVTENLTFIRSQQRTPATTVSGSVNQDSENQDSENPGSENQGSENPDSAEVNTTGFLPALLERFQAGSLADKHYGDLSTGQRQRAKLAAACLPDPYILFLDEPGANFDEAGRQLIKDLVDEFRQRKRMVVLASNQQHELDLADRILRLK